MHTSTLGHEKTITKVGPASSAPFQLQDCGDRRGAALSLAPRPDRLIRPTTLLLSPVTTSDRPEAKGPLEAQVDPPCDDAIATGATKQNLTPFHL